MRPGIILLTIFLVGNTVFSQSGFRFKGKGRKLKVERTISTSRVNRALVREVLHVDRLPTLSTTRTIVDRGPLRVVGPNSYLKGVSRGFKGRKGWEQINSSSGYNGAHHVVTRFVIKEITGKENSECMNNAPSVFHPLHNDLRYVDWFHNHQKQLAIYKEKGIRGIIEEFLEHVGNDFSREDKEQLMLEAELWAKHWNLKWE